MWLVGWLCRWFGEAVRERGWRGAVSAAAREGCYFLRDSTPSRRRQRYGDIDFDWEHRVNTTAGTVGWRTRLMGVLAGSYYQPSDPALFHEMMGRLPIDPADFTFIDIGSGKGRAVLLATGYGFRRIVGVEVLPELHQAAEENLRAYAAPRQCPSIELVCCDAAGFEFPLEPTVLYLFNPLHETGLRQLLSKLERSLESAPRPLWIVYHNPLLEQVFAGSKLTRMCGTQQYLIFTNAKREG